MTIVLAYITCGVLFLVLRLIGTSLAVHFLKTTPGNWTLWACIFEVLVWPAGLVVQVVALTVLVAMGVVAAFRRFAKHLREERVARRQFEAAMGGRPEPAFELRFETRDAGRTWRFQGEALPASPLTDRLQDAYTAVQNGWPPGTEVVYRAGPALNLAHPEALKRMEPT